MNRKQRRHLSKKFGILEQVKHSMYKIEEISDEKITPFQRLLKRNKANIDQGNEMHKRNEEENYRKMMDDLTKKESDIMKGLIEKISKNEPNLTQSEVNIKAKKLYKKMYDIYKN